MHTVLIVIHLFVAIGLVSVILMQRSEGGALGMGGGPGGLMSGRAAGDVLTRTTGVLAVLFFMTSIALTIIVREDVRGGSVVDQVDMDAQTGASSTPVEFDAPDLGGLGVDGAGSDGAGAPDEQPAGE